MNPLTAAVPRAADSPGSRRELSYGASWRPLFWFKRKNFAPGVIGVGVWIAALVIVVQGPEIWSAFSSVPLLFQPKTKLPLEE